MFLPFQMLQKYVWMTNRGTAENDLSKARDHVKDKCGKRAATKDFDKSSLTLTRYRDKCTQQNEKQSEVFGYTNCRIK